MIMSKDSISTGRMPSLVAELKDTIRANWDVPALSDLTKLPISYSDLASRIASYHLIFHNSGIEPADKIALCAKNSTEWAVAFLSILTYGAVAVPLLHEFHPDSIHQLVLHSDARLLFVDTSIWHQLDPERLARLDGVYDIEAHSLVLSSSPRLKSVVENFDSEFAARYPDGLNRSNFSDTFYHDRPDDLALINYTSGSTGLSKGVMLSYGNIWSNAKFAVDNIPYLQPGDGMVSMLPLAHMFGMLVELIFPLLKGCHITFLGRVPSPRILLDAFAQVRPKLVVTVPLVIEKIVRNRILPVINKPFIRFMRSIPGLNSTIYKGIRRKMIEAFGGNLEQLVIGGAALSGEVEALLRRIHFPFTVGYGMTECAPLISYVSWDRQKPGSCGKVVDRMRARIESSDHAHIPGLLWVKGDNVMKGYYKNPEATAEVFDNGWMNTGDICVIDDDGYVYIKGRDKSMILGPSGQNIYPEEIENILNTLPFVSESLIVQRDGALTALVYPDYEAAEKAQVSREKIDELMDYNLTTLNRSMPVYSKVARLHLVDEPFEKTPKHSIKRYLYK